MDDTYNKVKNFWNDRPCNIRHSDKKILSKEYFDEVEYKKYKVEPHIPVLAEFSRWKDKKVLEIGSGIGTDSINFARSGADLTIVEFSDKSLEICKERFKVYNLNAKFYQGNAEELSKFLPIEKYDLIYSFGVIHHTPHPENVFKQLTLYMNSDTELRVMLYSKISWKLFWVLFENKDKNPEYKVTLNNLDELICKNAEAQYNCPVAFTYTFDEIKNMLSPVNLSIQKIYKDHIFMYDIESYKKGEYKLDSYWENTSQNCKDIMCKELGWHTMFIAKSLVQ